MKLRIVESLSLPTIKKLVNTWEFKDEMRTLVNKYYPNQKSGDCIPINTSIFLAFKELGAQNIYLINGDVLLDDIGYDPGESEDGEMEGDSGLWHFWISLGKPGPRNANNVLDYATTVFHTREGNQVYIEQYYYDDWDLTGTNHGTNEKLKEEAKQLILKYVGKKWNST